MNGDPDPVPFKPFPTVSTRRLYDSSWCGLRLDRVELGDGRLQDYHVFEIAPAVCIVPVLSDGSIVMLWQYRYPHGATHWELPAGRIDEGESPEQAARRELLEETGYRPGRLERAFGFYPVNGISPHYASVFLAQDCVLAVEPDHDPSERMSVHVLAAEEVRRKLRRGEFEDGFTALALHHYFDR